MNKVAARQTSAQRIDLNSALDFVKRHHRSKAGYPGKNSRAVALQHGPDIVAVAIFANPRTSGKKAEYTTELYRLAFKTDTRVVGGASKLIKFFITEYNPIDFFTYQSLAGEKTEVYTQAGMSLVGVRREKQVLVKNGLTFATAKHNRSDWFSIEQSVRRGPDALIGTNIGHHQDKTNLDLFLENGYNLETTPGDRIYAWQNTQFSFYTYKITSSLDENYYIGRRIIRMASATEEDCLRDNYWGSGGEKFKNWVKKVGADSLRKEILGVYDSFSKMNKSEKWLIGDLHKTDPLCKNTLQGGSVPGFSTTEYAEALCSIHGLAVHLGSKCCRCSAAKIFTKKECATHGLVLHRGDHCASCAAQRNYSDNECAIHGLTKHYAGVCRKCSVQNNLIKRECSIHGVTMHQGLICSTCNAQKAITEKLCPIHGPSSHQGALCYNCKNEAIISVEDCLTHGPTKFQGLSCMKCNAAGQLSIGACSTHGAVTFKGVTCIKCTTAKALSQKHCEVHGLAPHQGDVCTYCNSQGSVSLKECPLHGLVKHQGDICNTCNALSSVKLEQCSKHGLTKHQGGKCSSCSNTSLITIKTCSVHGRAKHRRDSCYVCIGDRKAEKALKKKVSELLELGFDEARLRAMAESSSSANELVRLINSQAGHNVVYKANLQKILSYWTITLKP